MSLLLEQPLCTVAFLAVQRGICGDGGVAINGHCPIGYFERLAPVMGSFEFFAGWNETSSYFSSAEDSRPIRFRS